MRGLPFPDQRGLSFQQGAFLLKAFGLIDLSEAQWTVLFADMLALAGG
ncbi:hypothetical protein AB3G45_02250 [Shinella sp. S4-D37]